MPVRGLVITGGMPRLEARVLSPDHEPCRPIRAMQRWEAIMEATTEHSGSCLCGAVRVTASTRGNRIGACHCTMCRRWGGGPLLAVECESAVAFEGAESIATYRSSEWAERGFCKQCGTHLFYRLKQEQHYAIPVGLLDDSDQWVFAEQVFIDQKPSFYSFAEETKTLTGEEVFAQYSGK